MKLAVVVSHPIQYYAPWFRLLAKESSIELCVFYLWNFGVANSHDPDFQRTLTWNVPLLEGYDYEMVPNISKRPGTKYFDGLNNPELVIRLLKWDPGVILMFGYLSLSLQRVLWSSKLNGIPKILRGDSHRLFYRKTFLNLIKKNIITAIFKKFSAALYVGNANRDYLEMHGFNKKQLYFCPHAIDNARFFPNASTGEKLREKWQINDDEVLIIFSGKFEDKKCPIQFAQTFSKNSNKNQRLIFVGSGKYENSLNQIAQRDSRIKVHGFVNQAEMPDVYRAADLVVLPSYGTGETWGLSLQEAMACGCAVLASSHVGCAYDLIDEGKNGFTFPAGEWDTLRNILSQLPDSREKLKEIGRNSLKILEKYSYSKATEGLLAAINGVKNES